MGRALRNIFQCTIAKLGFGQVGRCCQMSPPGFITLWTIRRPSCKTTVVPNIYITTCYVGGKLSSNPGLHILVARKKYIWFWMVFKCWHICTLNNFTLIYPYRLLVELVMVCGSWWDRVTNTSFSLHYIYKETHIIFPVPCNWRQI